MRKNLRDIRVHPDDLPDGGAPDVRRNESFKTLVAHVKKHGVLTPVFVDLIGNVVSGHYRYWAAKFCEHRNVPAVVVRAVGRKAQLAECLEAI